jgi:hypothetical protein
MSLRERLIPFSCASSADVVMNLASGFSMVIRAAFFAAVGEQRLTLQSMRA